MTPSDYLRQYRHALDNLPLLQLGELIAMLRAARAAGYTVFIAGNGGSASTASHFATDLSKAAGVKAVSLADNVAMLTACANDCGYENVFAHQLRSFARVGDMLIVISVSAESPNVVAANNTAKIKGLLRIAFTGNEGGALRGNVDLELNIPSASYGLVEDLHLMLCHAVTEGLKE